MTGWPPTTRRRPLALVSKRFRRLVWEQPSLWWSVRLAAPEPTPLVELLHNLRTCCDEEWEQMLSHQHKWVTRQAALLSRVAHLVQHFALSGCDHLETAAHAATESAGAQPDGQPHTRLAVLLSALPPSPPLRHVQLASVDTEQPPPAALTNWLRSHSSLTALSLNVGPANSALLAAVCPRPQLLRLHLAGPEVSPQLLSALVAGLPQLTELKLRSTQRPFPPQTSQLSQLSRLQQLILQTYGPQGDSPASLPSPAAMPALLEYDYSPGSGTAGRIQVGWKGPGEGRPGGRMCRHLSQAQVAASVCVVGRGHSLAHRLLLTRGSDSRFLQPLQPQVAGTVVNSPTCLMALTCRVSACRYRVIVDTGSSSWAETCMLLSCGAQALQTSGLHCGKLACTAALRLKHVQA